MYRVTLISIPVIVGDQSRNAVSVPLLPDPRSVRGALSNERPYRHRSFFWQSTTLGSLRERDGRPEEGD